MQEKAVVQGVSGPALVQYVLPESDLSMDASGTETLNNIRDLLRPLSSRRTGNSWLPSFASPLSWQRSRICWTGSSKHRKGKTCRRALQADARTAQPLLNGAAVPFFFRGNGHVMKKYRPLC